MKEMELNLKIHNFSHQKDDLSEEQLNRLNDSIKQSQKGNCIPHTEMKMVIKKWLSQ